MERWSKGTNQVEQKSHLAGGIPLNIRPRGVCSFRPVSECRTLSSGKALGNAWPGCLQMRAFTRIVAWRAAIPAGPLLGAQVPICAIVTPEVAQIRGCAPGEWLRFGVAHPASGADPRLRIRPSAFPGGWRTGARNPAPRSGFQCPPLRASLFSWEGN